MSFDFLDFRSSSKSDERTSLPDEVDLDAVAACFPYGTLLPIFVTEGGMLGSSRAGLPEDEPKEALMTVANACVTVGWNEDVFSSDTFSWNSEDESS